MATWTSWDWCAMKRSAAGEGRWFRNALKLSGLPNHKGLDDFDLAFQPSWALARSATSPPGVRRAQGQRGLSWSDRGRQDDARRRPGDRGLPGRLLGLLHHPG